MVFAVFSSVFLLLDSELIWRFLYYQQGTYTSSVLSILGDLGIEFFLLLLPIFIVSLVPGFGSAVSFVFEAVYMDVFPGVFGSRSTPVQKLLRGLWYFLQAGILLEYTGFLLSPIGFSGVSMVVNITFLIALSFIFWLFSAVFSALTVREYSIALLIPPQTSDEPVGLVLVAIESLSFFTRSFSLGLRFFANMVSGSTIEMLVDRAAEYLFVQAVFLPGASIPAQILLFIYNNILSTTENIAAFVQPFIFVLLTTSNISETILYRGSNDGEFVGNRAL